jgi:hypothetical protein
LPNLNAQDWSSLGYDPKLRAAWNVGTLEGPEVRKLPSGKWAVSVGDGALNLGEFPNEQKAQVAFQGLYLFDRT